MFMSIKSKTSNAEQKGNNPFVMQPGHVRTKANTLSAKDDFRDIFPAMFSENDESMYIFWRNIPIRFHYTFDCFATLGKIIDVLELIVENEQGSSTMTFLTETLSAQWNVNWSNQQIEIESNWTSREDTLSYAQTLNEAGSIVMGKEAFTAEWKLPLVQVLNAIDAGKGRNLNESIEVKVEQIGTIVQAVDSFGIKYQKA